LRLTGFRGGKGDGFSGEGSTTKLGGLERGGRGDLGKELLVLKKRFGERSDMSGYQGEK